MKANEKTRQTIVFLIRAGISVALLGVVFVYVGPDKVFSELEIVSWPAIVLVVALIAWHLLICVRRWQLLLARLYGCRVEFLRLAGVFGAAELVGQILPSFVGMDLVRSVSLSRYVPMGHALRSVLCDRILGFVALNILILAVSPAFFLFVDRGLAFATVFAASAGSLAVFVALLTNSSLFQRLRLASIAPLISDLRAGLLRRHMFFPVTVLGLANHLVGVGLLWACGLVVGSNLGLWNCLLIGPAAFLISSIPISLGGWGLREGALAAGFALLGHEPHEVVMASILFGLAGVISGGIGGLMGMVGVARTQFNSCT